MKPVFQSIRDNLSNAFSLIGIILTVYFAVFYVPNYVAEIESRKIQSTHALLIESIQELVYNDHKIDGDDIRTLIRGKELSLDVSYPFTSEELLIQVQERFLANKFIPLDQRKALVEKIDEIRAGLPELPAVPDGDDEPGPALESILIAVLSSVAGLLVAVLGTISVWQRNKVIEEAKFESAVADRENLVHGSAQNAIQMEKQLYDALKEQLGDDYFEYCPPSTPVDFIIKTKSGRHIGVQLRSDYARVNSRTVVNRLLRAATELNLPVVLVSSAPLAHGAELLLADFNASHEDLFVEFVDAESEGFEGKIRSLFQ